MIGWLDQLKNKTPLTTHATKPTKPPHGEEKAGFVGFVAYPPAPLPKIEGAEPLAVPQAVSAATDLAAPALATDPDRWHWPHSPAMNRAEVDTFMARLVRFTDRGPIVPVAETLADGLVNRDREGDDRRLCLECAHLQGAGRWRCGNWQAADVASEGLAREFVLMLQRCAGYVPTGTNPMRTERLAQGFGQNNSPNI